MSNWRWKFCSLFKKNINFTNLLKNDKYLFSVYLKVLLQWVQNYHTKPDKLEYLRGIGNRIDYVEEIEDEDDDEEEDGNDGAAANPGPAANDGAVPINGPALAAAVAAAVAAANADPDDPDDVYFLEVNEVDEDELFN